MSRALEIARLWRASAVRLISRQSAGKPFLETLASSTPQYTYQSIENALDRFVSGISDNAVGDWLSGRSASQERTVLVLNASNIPFVGLRDLFSIHLMDHQYLGVLSRRDPLLLPAFVDDLMEICPGDLSPKASFCKLDFGIQNADKIIATGGDYLNRVLASKLDAKGIPAESRLLRGHKVGVVVLTGNETEEDLDMLSRDILLYDNRGCRSPAVLWAPKNFPLDKLETSLRKMRSRYSPSELLKEELIVAGAMQNAMNSATISTEGLLLSKGEPRAQQPGHIRLSEYTEIDEVATWIRSNSGLIQYLGGASPNAERLGTAHSPSIQWDPDGIDIIDFLCAN